MNNETLKIEIDNIKEDIKTNREEFKENIKEIKQDNKEMKEYFRDTIEVLKENSIRQTEILSRYDQQFVDVKNDITELNTKIDTTIENQKVDIMTVIRYVATAIGGLILGYIGVKLGIK